MSNRSELTDKYGSFYDTVSRENSRKWNELKSDRGDPWRQAKKAYKKASAGNDGKAALETSGYKAQGYNILKQCIRLKQLSKTGIKSQNLQNSLKSLIDKTPESGTWTKKFSPEKLTSNGTDSSGNLFDGFNGIGLNLNLGYLGMGVQRIFHRGEDVDYIYFQYNHKPGVNVCGSLFKVFDFDEENYKGWFVDGGAFLGGLGIDFFTSPEVEEPVCRGWGINLAYPFESGLSIVPQYYDTPSGWMGKVFKQK